MAKKSGDIDLFTLEGESVQVKNCLLLDFLLWDFSWDFERAEVKEKVQTIFPKFKDRPKVTFKIEKVNATQFEVEFKRHTVEGDIKPDDGYFLDFIITIFGFNGPMKRRVMDYEHDTVSVVYNYGDLSDMQKQTGYWVLKCVVKMNELHLLENDARIKQNEMILKLANTDEYKDKLADMAYLLKLDSFKDIFSGRQSYEFALEKACLLERSMKYVNEIAAKCRAKENDTEYNTPTELGVYLNYILCGDSECIDSSKVLELYIMAHNYGLRFLADECADFILVNIDFEYIVHVLMYADMAQDLILLNLALDAFVYRRSAIFRNEAWEKISNENRLYAQNVIDLSIRKMKFEINIEQLQLRYDEKERHLEYVVVEGAIGDENANEIAAGS